MSVLDTSRYLTFLAIIGAICTVVSLMVLMGCCFSWLHDRARKRALQKHLREELSTWDGRLTVLGGPPTFNPYHQIQYWPSDEKEEK